MRKRSHSTAYNSDGSNHMSRKRRRMVGRDGRRDPTPEIQSRVIISDSESNASLSDEEVSGSDINAKNLSQSDLSAISDSDADNPFSTNGQTSQRRPKAEVLAAKYSPGNPDFDSETESQKLAESSSKKETSEKESYAKQCIASAHRELDSKELEHAELSKRMVQDGVRERELVQEKNSIREVIKVLEGAGL